METTFQHGQQHDHHVLLQVHQFFQELDLTGVLQRATRGVGDSGSKGSRNTCVPPEGAASPMATPPNITGPRKMIICVYWLILRATVSLDCQEVNFLLVGECLDGGQLLVWPHTQTSPL